MALQQLATNLSGNIRKEKLQGRDYLVAPMVMITEGVHSGSKGRLYYPSDELLKTHEAWDHKPISIYHPKENGTPVSACSPAMLEKHNVGIILNTEWDKDAGKLRAEAWLEEKRLKSVDKRVYNSILKGEIVEVSTGLFTDDIEVDGEWNGEAYDAIARNYRPDHLAILPDQIGACSVADGAGLLQVNEEVRRAQEVVSAFVLNEYKERTDNEQSHSALWMQLESLVREEYGAYLDEVYDGYCIYSLGGKKYKLSYTLNGEDAVLGSSPEKVTRVVTYQPATNANEPRLDKEDAAMKKSKLIDALIANKKSGWEESDRKTLESFSEHKLGTFVANAEAETAPVTPPTSDGGKEGEDDDSKGQGEEESKGTPPAQQPSGQQTQPNPPAQNRKLTLDDLPVEVRQMVANANKIVAAEKQRLVSIIVANENNVLTEDQLAAMDVETLRPMAALARPQQGVEFDMSSLDYSGQGLQIAANAADDDDDEEGYSPPPTFNAAAYNAAQEAKKNRRRS